MDVVRYRNRAAPFEAIPTWLFKDGQAGGFWLPRPLVRGRNQLYQDAAGTALVAPGDPVGLMMDISKGVAKGPELFEGSWNHTEEWANNEDGSWTADGSQTENIDLRSNSILDVGKLYEVQFDVDHLDGGHVTWYFGRSTPRNNISTTGSHKFKYFAESATFFIFRANAGVSTTISNISIREIPGAHLSQSVSGSRPVLVREPEGGRRNLLTWTEDLSQGPWSTKGLDAVAVADPKFGTAIQITATGEGQHQLRQGFSTSGQIMRTFAVKPLTGRYIVVSVTSSTAVYSPVVQTIFDTQTGEYTDGAAGQVDRPALPVEDLGDGWFRIGRARDSNYLMRIMIANGPTVGQESFEFAANGESFLIAEMQAEEGEEATPYQRVTNTYDVCEEGKAHHTYLQLDKVDDNLSVILAQPITGTMLLATTQGIVHADVDITAGEWSITADPQYYPGDTLVGLILRDGQMNEQELQAAKDYLISIGAGADQFAGVEGVGRWFADRKDITSLHADDWDVSNVTDFNRFITGARNLLHLGCTEWNTSSATSFNRFAHTADALPFIDVSGWDTSGVTTFINCFFRAASLTELDISNWDTSSVNVFSGFANGATSLHTVIVNGGTGNPFADSPCTNYANAFINTNLSQQSIDDILVAIEAAGTSNGTFGQSGGSAPSARGMAAVYALRARGWEITVTDEPSLAELMFAGDEEGALYIPEPQYLFQDAAGTTPVTSDGDPVGLMLDLSGNDNHATQEVSGSRPIYRTDGNKHWLEFDLVDDFFLLFTLPGGLSWSLRFSTTPRYADKGFAFLTKLNANNPWLFAAYEGNSNTSLAGSGVYPQLWRFDGEDVEIATRDDAWNLTQTSNVYGVDFTSNTWENVIIGEYTTNEASFVPYMHGMILRETFFSEQENALVDAYLANLAGVSLND